MNLFFNKPAAAYFAGKPSVRVRIDPDTRALCLRPTQRRRGDNDLVALQPRARGGIKLTLTETVPGLRGDDKLCISPGRYGWLTVQATQARIGKNSAHGRVGRSADRRQNLTRKRY